MADIFLSYAREDRARAESIAKAFARKGWSVWWDRSIQVGKSFSRVIEKELDAARCVVVLWSSRSIQSDWVLSEAAEGMHRGILIPIAIEESLRLPLEFRRLHTANLTAWPGKPADFDDCIRAIAALLESPGTPSAHTPPVKAPPDRVTDPTVPPQVIPQANLRTSDAPPSPIYVHPDRTQWIVLSYLGVISLVPYFVTKNDPDREIRWHARNGMALFLAEVVMFVASLAVNSPTEESALVISIRCLIWLAFLVISIVSMVKGVNGQRFITPGLTAFAEKYL